MVEIKEMKFVGIGSSQGVVIGLDIIDEEWLDNHPDIEVIGTNTTGLDHIDLEECAYRMIKVISLNDFPKFKNTITSTAEHTIGLFIALLRKYREALLYQDYERDLLIGHRLNGKLLGIIGFGRIGKQVKKMAKGLGVDALTYDVKRTTKEDKIIRALEIMGLVRKWHFAEPLDNLIAKSDIVSLHIPLEGNEEFFTREMFTQMKDTAYFVNTSRSGIVEKGALVWALKNGIITGAAVDFLDDKELVKYAETHDNLILTNHLGGNTFEDREKTEQFMIKEVSKCLK